MYTVDHMFVHFYSYYVCACIQCTQALGVGLASYTNYSKNYM